MAEKRRGLGRGLGALIANGPVETPDSAEKEETAQTTVADAADDTSKNTGKKSSETRATPAKQGAGAKRSSSQKSATDEDKQRGSAQGTSRQRRAPVGSGADLGQKPATRRSRPSDMFFTSTSPAEPAEVDKTQRRSVPDVLGNASRRRAAEKSGSQADFSTGQNEDDLLSVPGATFAEVDIAEIHPNRKQPREVFDQDELDELVHSIKEVGLLQPIVVRPSRESEGPSYELVMGERRWRASQAAGLTKIPAIVRDTGDADLLRDALLENLHRSQLNPLEEAAAYQQLMNEFDCTQDELSARIGRSRPQISNTIRLMRLPALVQRRVAAGVLSSGHARALLGVEDPEEVEKLAQRIVNEGLSVRATEEAASQLRGEGKSKSKRRKQEPQRHERLDHLANNLQDRFDTNVKITLGARKGKVQIEFASVEDLDRIIALMNAE